MYQTVGERIKILRKRKKITQLELAQKLEVSKSTIAMYEIGKNFPNVLMIKKLAYALDTTGDYLIGLVNSPNETYTPSAKTKTELKQDEKMLVTDYRKLNLLGKEKAQEYTKDLTGNKKYTAADEEHSNE